MIEFYIGKMLLRFEFSFFVVLAIFSVLDKSGYGFISLFACVCHECGHILAMKIKKRKIDGLVFYGGGIRLKKTEFWDGFFVTVAGSLVNLILFLLFYYTSDYTNLFLLLFAITNLIIGCFNLLPIGRLDGKRILEMLLIHFLTLDSVERVLRIVEVVFFLLVVLTGVLLLLNGLLNPSLIAAIVYISILDMISKKIQD